ncbi:MAG: DUF1549 and DUF1553 domain-containing protein [Gemmataceae bacterium]|nr:DUF1549 and DUF1553 domain-containing protein [Gemmataceae bacterium]MDW8266650.1 DUF1549 and DUF1553 domain-containing protein [Gemmataceae bacterium]
MTRLPTQLWVFTFCCAWIALPSVLWGEERPLRQRIDAEVRAAWEREQITPAGLADDAAFLRRVYLDLVGCVPSYDEVRQFLQDNDPQKRAKVIDRLLDDPRFADHQANVWDQVLFGRHPLNPEATRKRDSFKKWLSGKFTRNEPYDRWVRELLRAEEEGSELFYVQFRNQPEEATVAVSRIFLGTQLQCARCHDHPFENWTQRDFYGMAGFFVRLVVLDNGGSGNQRRYTIGEKATGEVLFTGAVKDQKPGQKGEPVKPKFLLGPVLDEPPLPAGYKEPDARTAKTLPKPPFSRKEKLAEWVTARDNPFFARAVANRVWAQFLGRGLVHPVDDLGEHNLPSHPELLQTLTDELLAHGFDLKWLIRELVNSQTYQLASTGPSTEALPRWYERARVRPLSAEELLASFRQATGYDNANPNRPDGRLPNATEEYFLIFFGEPTNGLGEFQGSLSEHLFLNNSGQVWQFVQRRKGNLADVLLSSTEPWEQRVDRLFLSILSRLPSAKERQAFVAHLNSADGKAEARVAEAIWALINSSEFRFNH